MEVTEKMWLAILKVPSGQISRFALQIAFRARRNCGRADRRVANGCILNPTGVLKMEIPSGIFATIRACWNGAKGLFGRAPVSKRWLISE